MKAVVIGLGKIGLPLAVQIAGKGVRTTGSDINPRIVESVNASDPPFQEPGLTERLGDVVERGLLKATVDSREAVSTADAVLVVVPLLIDDVGRPDFRGIDSVTRNVGSALSPGVLVSFETTLPVGTTRGRFGPLLEKESGLVAGVDFHLVHSPERVSSGRVFADFSSYPKLLGGINRASTAAGVDFYSRVLDFSERPELVKSNGVWSLGSAEAAEFAKLAETTYRDVNIALANEFSRHAEALGLDVWEIIDAANSQPFSHLHRPGIAVGGHCIPVYPHFYLAGDSTAQLPRTARHINEQMPQHAIETIEAALGRIRGHSVVILGAAYRGGVKEITFSGVFSLVDEIVARGGRALVHDPLYTDDELAEFDLQPYRRGVECSAAIVQTDHLEYKTWQPSDLPGIRLIYDGRAILDPTPWKLAGIRYIRLGVAQRSVGLS